MSIPSTAVTATPPPPPPPRPRTRPPRHPALVVLGGLASLRLTVILFVFALFLVFVGTLGQKLVSNEDAVKDYFRCFFAWVPFRVFLFAWPKEEVGKISNGWGFWFPGGWTIGTALLINLLAAHAVRFKVSWKRSGILLTHAGLIVLLLGELITGLFQVESHMSIAVGETVNFLDVQGKHELALISGVDGKTENVVAIPGDRLRKGGRISDDKLPVDVRVDEFVENTDYVTTNVTPPNQPRLSDKTGQLYTWAEKDKGTGVDTEQHSDAPAVQVTFLEKGGDRELGTYRLSMWCYPNFSNRALVVEPVYLEAGGKRYEVVLRYKRDYKPYTIRLDKFTHELYPGTDVPKNFQSDVHFVADPDDAGRREARDVRIFMNNPLRHAGETFYQAGYFSDNSGTVLQVVRNPGWLMPYLSCVMVTVGLLIHFGLNVVEFLRRRVAI
jgi:hypothetical protein